MSAASRGPPTDAAGLGANLTKTPAPTLKERAELRVHIDEDAEVYSDPDEGVEIVDMRNVHAMDWMAPESLKWEGKREKTKKVVKVKKEEEETTVKGKGARACLLPPGLLGRLTDSISEKLSRRQWSWMDYQLWMTQETLILPMPWTSAKAKRKKRWKTLLSISHKIEKKEK
jgi:hypothetical protein